MSGCWDRSEIEEKGFVIATGLDKGKEPGQVMVTYQIANPQVGLVNAPTEAEQTSDIITFPAPDFLTAKDLANSKVARKLTFSHMKVFIVSEELARTGEFLRVIKASLGNEN